MGLRGFEDRLERLVEGSLTMPFRGPMQPIEISHRMLREMDLGRRVGVRGLIAPNHFAVSISKSDLDRFEGFTDALVHELAESARQHATNEGYAFTGPVEVELFESKRLKAGRAEIVASFFEGDVSPNLVLPDGKSLRVSSNPIVIGRLPECEVCLGDTNVSRRHAQVALDAGDVVVTDLGSTNGTFVNGRRVTRATVRPGDELTIGTSRLRVEVR
ncbi:MAG TPA: DUF3662 and FHA domain-containing protein [Acidimicrobiales bacterium]